jgi:selenocysteine lyase/cysteine desulfurase
VVSDSALALTAALAKRDIFVAARGGGVRVSPHFYNSEDEVRGLLTAVDEIVHTEGAGG